MSRKGKAIKAAALSMAVMIASPVVSYAASFNDVPESFWAYEAVESISSQGLMEADEAGNFKPDSFIDKFETSKIFAKALGYNYASGSSQDKAYYDKIYNERKALLDKYDKKYEKWNSNADKEIAFLLEKGFFKNEDIDEFIIVNKEGKEQLRALSREEAAVFLVRLMGKEEEAKKLQIADKFSDDANINASKKQSVYYLKSLGILSGNTDGRFNPNGGIIRADFCVLLNNTLKHMGKTLTPNTTENQANENKDVVVNNIEMIIGVFDKYFPSLNVIQLSVGSEQKLYKVTSSATLKVNGFNASLADIKEGMKITAVINNSEIVQLEAVNSIETNEAEDMSQNTGISSDEVLIDGSTSIVDTGESDISTITATITESDLTTIVGSVESINGNSITLNYRMVNSRDEINSQSKTYTIADNAIITKNANVISSADINVDDIASAKILGSKIYSMEVEGANLSLNSAKLVKKYYNKEKSMPALVIEALGNKSYELYVTENSQMARNTDDETAWDDLKVGDTINVTTQYNKIDTLYAKGEKRELEGYVTQIRIGEDSSYIGLSTNENASDFKLYTIDEDTVDLYSIKIGDKVKMYLESEEVVTVNVRKTNSSKTFTGYITDNKSTYIMVEGSENGETSRKKVEYDEDTVVLSSVTGKKLKIKELEDDMKVYVVFDASESKLAKTITVLSNN